MRLHLSRQCIVRGHFLRSWGRYRCTVYIVNGVFKLVGLRGIARVCVTSWATYELKGNAASLDAANGDVEEDARALWILLAHFPIFSGSLKLRSELHMIVTY